jgi:hypothetical protein
MTVASLSPGIAEAVVRIIWFSVASPRQAVRELLSAADVRTVSWIIVSLGVAISAISAGIAEWLNLRNQSDPSLFTFFGPGQAVAEAGASAVLEGVVGALSYPVTALLWTYVFGFRDRTPLVWGAVTTVFALYIVVNPMLDIVGYFATTPEVTEADWIVLAAYSVVVIALSSYYFVEALSIGLLRAILINSAVFAMLIVGVVIVTFFLYLFFGFMIYDGTEVTP